MRRGRCMGGERGATRRDVAGAVAVLGVGGEQAGVVPLLHDDEGDLGAVVAAGLEVLARGVDLRAGAARVGGPPDMVPTHDTPNRMQGAAGWASGRSPRATGGRGGREGGGAGRRKIILGRRRAGSGTTPRPAASTAPQRARRCAQTIPHDEPARRQQPARTMHPREPVQRTQTGTHGELSSDSPRKTGFTV